MSPEQLEGTEADHRADIWAFGCVVYELISGKKAFEGRSQASVIGAIVESQKGRYSVGRFSGEAACPRSRGGSTLRLDTGPKPWHKRDDWLGPSEHRGGHRGPEAFTFRPSPQLAATRQPTAIQ